MRKLVVAEFMTLDGVMEAPGFEEHPDGKNAWALRFQTEEMQRFINDQYASVDAYFLGRTTYQIWAAFWPTAPGDQELAKRMNDTPKYVVSNTLKEADWSNSTIVRGDDLAAQVAELKRQGDGDIFVIGSADLVAGLMEHDLVDEYQLLVFPVILGSGKHVFRDGIDLRPLRLVNTRAFGSGAVLLTYRPESEMPTSEYVEEYSRFGVSWQVIPRQLPEMLDSPDREAAARAMTAMLEMTKIDVAKLQEAYEGVPAAAR